MNAGEAIKSLQRLWWHTLRQRWLNVRRLPFTQIINVHKEIHKNWEGSLHPMDKMVMFIFA
jgi:hypothetical protein